MTLLQEHTKAVTTVIKKKNHKHCGVGVGISLI